MSKKQMSVLRKSNNSFTMNDMNGKTKKTTTTKTARKPSAKKPPKTKQTKTKRKTKIVESNKKPVGRPPTFNSRYHVKWAESLMKFGADEKDVAEEFGISCTSLVNWKRKSREFSEAIERGREFAKKQNDELKMVERSLVDQAKRGNVTAIKEYLHNTAPDKWKERQDVGIHGDVTYTIKPANFGDEKKEG